MAFATQCPHCQTTFRVAQDQLKLRAGLVRCGACKEIFNGVEHLLRSEEVPVMPAVPAAPVALVVPPAAETLTTMRHEGVLHDDPPRSQVSLPVADLSSESREDALSGSFFDLPSTSAPTDLRISASQIASSEATERSSQIDRVDGLDHTNETHSIFVVGDHAPANSEQLEHDEVEETPVAFAEPLVALDEISSAPVHQSTHESADELDQAIDYLQRKPWRGAKQALSREDVEGPRVSDNEEDVSSGDADLPDFVSRSRALQKRRRWIHRSLIALTVLLTAGAVAQSLYLWRDQIAARLPASKPVLISVCQMLGCRIELPAQIDAVSIESNELVTLAAEKNIFGLNLLLRNRSTLPQRWPAIELTLLDNNDRPVVRRVFNAGDYLPPATDSTRGFAQNTEQSAKITFELVQQKAANYRVYLFYP